MHPPEYYMSLALEEAYKALQIDEVPIGAIVVHPDSTITRGHNGTISYHDPTAHAEIIAIRSMCQIMKNYRIPDCELYVTLQPCLMCLGVIEQCRIRKVYFGAFEKKYRIDYTKLSTCSMHGPLLEDSCSGIISDFFTQKRTDKD